MLGAETIPEFGTAWGLIRGEAWVARLIVPTRGTDILALFAMKRWQGDVYDNQTPN